MLFNKQKSMSDGASDEQPDDPDDYSLMRANQPEAGVMSAAVLLLLSSQSSAPLQVSPLGQT